VQHKRHRDRYLQHFVPKILFKINYLNKMNSKTQKKILTARKAGKRSLVIEYDLEFY